MKIERSRLKRWLNNPVTKAYCEVFKNSEREILTILGSDTIPQENVLENYNRHMGALTVLRDMVDPENVIVSNYEIIEDEEILK